MSGTGGLSSKMNSKCSLEIHSQFLDGITWNKEDIFSINFFFIPLVERALSESESREQKSVYMIPA